MGNLHRINLTHVIIKKVIFILIIFSFIGCDQLKVGNAEVLALPVKTKIRTSLVRQYIDSVNINKVPEKWLDKDKFIDLDNINFKRIYFPSDPEEIYILSFQGSLTIADIYNPKIRKGRWVGDIKFLSEKEKTRIVNRVDKEILKKIENIGLNSGIPDSLIYK